MKKYIYNTKTVGLLVLIMSFIASCEKEPVELTGAKFEITTPEPYKAGEAISFKIIDKADFFSFFSGAKNEDYANYPKSKGTAVTDVFSYVYSQAGTYDITLVGNSFGEQATKFENALFTKTISVIDARTGLSDFSILNPSLKGVIDNSVGIITFTVTGSQDISNLTPLIIPVSKQAKIYQKGKETNVNDTVVKGAAMDFNKDTLFTVVAPHGEKQDFRVSFIKLGDPSRALLTFTVTRFSIGTTLTTTTINATINEAAKTVNLAMPTGTNLGSAIRIWATSSSLNPTAVTINTTTGYKSINKTSPGNSLIIAANPTTIKIMAESGAVAEYTLNITFN
jgi:hypothetical protein